MSDEPEGDGSGTLVRGPWSGDSSYTLPPIPDFADTIPAPEDIPAPPPESPEETTMELPPIPAAPNPATALRSDGITRPESGEGDGESEEGEYVQPRTLADRLGDWLEFRIEKARAGYESEAPFREAEIGRKAALLAGRTAQEVAMMEQNGKLHAAMMKAKGDKSAARGKADADRMKSPSGSGLGADKGRSKTTGGGTGGSGRSAGGGRGAGTNGPGRGSGGGNSPKGAGKGPDRSPGGRGGSRKGNESSGGSKGRQNRSGSSGTGNGSSGKGSSGGSGSGKGDSKGGRGRRTPDGSAGPAAERSRGRHERAAARRQRRAADHSAKIADRTKDRDQARVDKQTAREERRKDKVERKAARKAKREAAKSADDRTTLSAAVAEEARRRWEERHAAAEEDKARKAEAKVGAGDGKDSEDTTKKRSKGGPATSSDGPTGASATKEPDGGKTAGGKPSDGSGDKNATGDKRTDDSRPPDDDLKDDPDDDRSYYERIKDRWGKPKDPAGETSGRRRGGRSSDSPFGAGDSAPTAEWPDHPTGPPPSTADSGEQGDIEDAVIVPDDPAALTTGVKGLPPGPEKHTARPGTSRTTSTEGSSVSSAKGRRPTGQGGLAAKHRTDITFDTYLMEMANTAIQASSDQERAETLMRAIGKVADALRDMATDLVDDHNIEDAVIDLITAVADAALRMKQQAKRAGEMCGVANEAAKLAATMVARVYGEDMNAKQDAGLRHTSAAAHHD